VGGVVLALGSGEVTLELFTDLGVDARRAFDVLGLEAGLLRHEVDD
jgi:hypothetical protein